MNGGKITVDALAKHNERMDDKDTEELHLAHTQESESDPFVSIRRLYNSPSESHREVSVL